MDRRRFLATTALAAGLSGCLDGLGGGTSPDTAAERTDWSLPDHPALAAIADQPIAGPDPGKAPGLIVAFEDPSCPTCRRFEQTVFPEMDSTLLTPGKATFVYRGIPVIAPWGQPASFALEATFDRDSTAFWDLKHHYFAEQAAFSTSNVLERTERFLARETAVDAGGVVKDVREQVHEPAIRTDLAAAREAGVRGTPTFYLFREGEAKTSFTGPQSLSVFRRVLEV